jgi:hypothetical protein
MSVRSRFLVAAAVAMFSVGSISAPALAGAATARPPGHLVIVQAVPADALDVTIDGRMVQQDSRVGAILGPVTVSPGRHQVGFTDGSGSLRLTSTVEVAPGSSSDIVIHLPADVGGAPVVNAYRTPRAPIAPGKARVLIAHTATVAPADVRVDGKVVFHDIANGEYATADLAAGPHTVALLPAGLTTKPILGPLHVELQAGTVTMVYAVGNPRDGSMNVIAHTVRLASNGAVVPETIDTGSAGLAAALIVHPFHARATTGAEAAVSPASTTSWRLLMGVALLVGAVVVMLCRRRPRPGRTG